MVNHFIRIGLDNNCHTMKKLSLLSYQKLKSHQIKYKLTAISEVAGRLAQMKKDIRNGKKVMSPFVRKPYLVSCYDFKINGHLLSLPVSDRQFVNILLNDYTKILSDDYLKPRSFTITPNSLAITVRKQAEPKGTSRFCPICGVTLKEDKLNRRKSWCSNCSKSMDRDIVSMNIAYKARFTHPGASN